jgi:truncated hemoglobin YjbI
MTTKDIENYDDCLKMTTLFYQKLAADELLQPIFTARLSI